jgi:hypothetical protein
MTPITVVSIRHEDSSRRIPDSRYRVRSSVDGRELVATKHARPRRGGRKTHPTHPQDPRTRTSTVLLPHYVYYRTYWFRVRNRIVDGKCTTTIHVYAKAAIGIHCTAIQTRANSSTFARELSPPLCLPLADEILLRRPPDAEVLPSASPVLARPLLRCELEREGRDVEEVVST